MFSVCFLPRRNGKWPTLQAATPGSPAADFLDVLGGADVSHLTSVGQTCSESHLNTLKNEFTASRFTLTKAMKKQFRIQGDKFFFLRGEVGGRGGCLEEKFIETQLEEKLVCFLSYTLEGPH